MFEKDAKSRSTITKIDGKGRFVDVTQWFEVGKVVFTFCTYDDSLPGGSRIKQEVKCFLSIEDAANFANLCESGRFRDIALHNLKEQQASGNNSNYPICIYEKYGGSSKDKVVSKRLSLSMKSQSDKYYKSLPFTLQGEQGEGRVVDNGAIRPVKGYSEYVAIGLTTEQVYALGVQLKRAVTIYDFWLAAGTLETRVKELEYKRNGNYGGNNQGTNQGGNQSGNRTTNGSGYNNRYESRPENAPQQGYARTTQPQSGSRQQSPTPSAGSQRDASPTRQQGTTRNSNGSNGPTSGRVSVGYRRRDQGNNNDGRNSGFVSRNNPEYHRALENQNSNGVERGYVTQSRYN